MVKNVALGMAIKYPILDTFKRISLSEIVRCLKQKKEELCAYQELSAWPTICFRND